LGALEYGIQHGKKKTGWGEKKKKIMIEAVVGRGERNSLLGS